MGTADDDERQLLPFDDGGEWGQGRLMRRQWRDGRWFFSVVDVVAILTDSADPGNYWSTLKRRIADEGASEVVTNCHRLKMRALDGKLRETDAADAETMLRIVQSIPSPKAEPVKQWLAHLAAQRLEDEAAKLDEGPRRQLLRGEIAEKNRGLASTVSGAGVVTARDFAIFQDWGYRGLYAGETARDIAARKGLARGQRILDWMGSEELAANWFRITQAEAKLRRESVADKADANATHHAVGREVRETIQRLGGTMPEQLPTPAESIAELRRRERQRLEAERQPSLFADADRGEGGNGDEG
jgi:DNA-damage-inducible protein D